MKLKRHPDTVAWVEVTYNNKVTRKMYLKEFLKMWPGMKSEYEAGRIKIKPIPNNG